MFGGLKERLPFLLALRRELARIQINRIGFLLLQAALRQEGQKVLVAAVGIEQDDLFKAVAPDLIQHALEELHEQGGLDGDCAGEAARFVDLAEVEGREDDRLFLLGGQAGDGVPGEVVGAEGQVGAVTLDHATGEDAHAGGFHGEGEFSGGEVFPLHRGLLLR